jgi:hypothetical protein
MESYFVQLKHLYDRQKYTLRVYCRTDRVHQICFALFFLIMLNNWNFKLGAQLQVGYVNNIIVPSSNYS